MRKAYHNTGIQEAYTMANSSFSRFDLHPAYGEKNIPVVFVTDENYLPYLKVTLCSLLQNCKSGKLDILVFHGGMPQDALDEFLASFAGKDISIRFVSLEEAVANSELGKIKTVAYFTQAASYRLIISDVLVNYSKVIYLDIDIIVEGDIGELYATDMQGAWVAAARGIGYPDYVAHNEKRRLWNLENCSIPPEDYFNSGILLMDCEAFRKHVSTEEMFRIAATSPFFPDQDALNIACRGHVHFLDMKWNTQVDYCARHLTGDDGERFLSMLFSAGILHYSTSRKPWSAPSSFMAERWWRYVPQEERALLLEKLKPAAKEVERPIRLHYYAARPNFGDSLNQLLIESITGSAVRHANSPWCDLFAVGSIFSDGKDFFTKLINTPNSPALHVWGSGFLDPIDVEGPVKHSREVIVHACRGKETLRVLRKAGLVKHGEEPVLGDPGILYPDAVPGCRDLPKLYELSLIPHWRDKAACEELAQGLEEKGFSVHVIDVQMGNPSDVIREIAQSRKVISSSMHGVIVSDALNVPNKRLIFSKFFDSEADQFELSFFKYRDYYSAFDMEAPDYVTDAKLLEDPAAVIDSMGEGGSIPMDRIEDCKKKLLAVFPFPLVESREQPEAGEVRLSVIIPVYNVEFFLNDCLSSLLNQKSFVDMEVICVDDSSTDGSAAILEQWQKRDSRLKVVKLEHAGPGTARNKAMEMARGDYIMFLDSDDRISSGEALRAAFEQTVNDDLDVLVADACNMTALGTAGKACYMPRNLLPEERVFTAESLDMQKLVLKNLAPWAKIFKRSFLEEQKLSFLPIARSEDFPFIHLALACAKKIGVLPQSLVDHRVGLATSLESTKDETPWIFAIGEEHLHEELKKRGLYDIYGSYARLRACTRLAWNLNAMKTFEGFAALYAGVGDFYAQYALSEDDPLAGEQDYQNALKSIENLLASSTPEELIFQQLRDSRIENASLRKKMADSKGSNEAREENRKLQEYLVKKDEYIAHCQRKIAKQDHLLKRKIVKLAVKLHKAFMKLKGKK